MTKSHSEMQKLKKASENVFLFQITLKINFSQIVRNNHYSDASSRTPCFGALYPQGVQVPPVKNPCIRL